MLARPGGHRNNAYLVELIASAGITTIHFVPSMLAVFIEEPRLERCTSLRCLVCAGEALPFELQERAFARLPGVEVHNLYGPTEAAVGATGTVCTPSETGCATVPIGRPISNTRIYLLDEHLAPVEDGTQGEIFIAGVGVGRGYLRRPALTAERFLPDSARGRARRTNVPNRKISRGGCRMAASSSSAASIIRSKFEASGSSSARSRPRCCATPTCERWWCWRTTTRQPARSGS